MDNPPDITKVKVPEDAFKRRPLLCVLGYVLFVGVPLAVVLLVVLLFMPLPERLEVSPQKAAVSDAKQMELNLFEYAYDHDGKYPDDLAAFVQAEFTKEELVPPHIKRLLYKKDTEQFRWILTPGLTTSDDPRTILLQSADRDKKGGLVYCTVGHFAAHTKNPDKDIITVSGKPMIRGK